MLYLSLRKVIIVKVMNLREFRENLSKIIEHKEKVVLAKRNKPIYILQPIDPVDEFMLWLEEASDEIKSAGLKDKEIKKTFEEARDAADEKANRS